MIRRILCPIDFSAASDEALRYAANLATRFGASITVMHVFQVPGYVLPEGYLVAGPQTVSELSAQLDAELERARKTLVADGVGAVDTRLEQGVASQRIIEAVDDGDYDLIVMGTHGRTGLGRAVLGSVAEKVVRKARCPVLTVHAPRQPTAETRPPAG